MDYSRAKLKPMNPLPTSDKASDAVGEQDPKKQLAQGYVTLDRCDPSNPFEGRSRGGLVQPAYDPFGLGYDDD